MGKTHGGGSAEYAEISVEIFGVKQRLLCLHTCDRCCGRSCMFDRWHEGRCWCKTDCDSDVGPFDHLSGTPEPLTIVGALPFELILDDTTEVEPLPEGQKFFLPPPGGYVKVDLRKDKK